MFSEIGSNFWTVPGDDTGTSEGITPEVFGISGADYVWLSTGHAAIEFALGSIDQEDQTKRIALLPPFTCHTVVEPFLKAGYRVEFMSLRPGLCVSGEELVEEAERSDAGVILFHRYFGFDTLMDCDRTIDRLRALGVKVIEDRTQCLYSGFASSPADYIVGSIRKWHGTPDGGFCVSREKELLCKPVETDKVLEEAKLKAGRMKYEYLFHGIGEKKDFLRQFRKAEDILSAETQFYGASDITLRMQASLDCTSLANRRRENYQTVLELLAGDPLVKPVFPILPDDVVPLYFPVAVENRGEVQRYLAEHAVYAPIIWPKAECVTRVCPEAERMYQNLLCLPIDQRYAHDDMERMVGCLDSFCQMAIS